MKEIYPSSDPTLEAALENVRPEELPTLLRDLKDRLITGSRPFAIYMRGKFVEKRLRQQHLFLTADISENYGYKLIAEEKHTVDRDVILRICLAARFDLAETQEALILYGMAPLYPRLPRDIVLMTAIRNGIFDADRINELLLRCGQEPMTKNTD